jgi:hypothetical protein
MGLGDQLWNMIMCCIAFSSGKDGNSIVFRELFSVNPEKVEALGFALKSLGEAANGIRCMRNIVCHNLFALNTPDFESLTTCAQRLLFSLRDVLSCIDEQLEYECVDLALAQIDGHAGVAEVSKPVPDFHYHKLLWLNACFLLRAHSEIAFPFVRSVMERLHRRVIAKVKLDIMADLGVCDVEDWDCSTCSDADNSTYTEDCPVSLAIRSIDANGVADCGTVHNLKFMTFHPCFVKIGPARRDDPLILCPYPTHIYEPRSSQVIFMEQIDLDSSVACLQPFRVTRVTPGQPDLEFLAVFCHGCPGDVRISVSQHLEGHRSSGSRRFWALTNKNKKINPSYPSAFIEMRHGLRRGHTVLFHRDASILPSGIEEGRLYIVNNALKFSFSVCGPILKLNDADVVIRRSPVGRYVSALLCARTWRSHVDT